MNFDNTTFNNDKNKYLVLGYGCRYDAAVLNKFDADGVSILSCKKH